ncbi:MAG TPA: hypothetical protein PLS15_02945 [Fimbriimonadaceae bacterium]|nr:hypothetical protein [Fimbriimonadaceae bacterium]HRE93100.1 hypothetical protein [Fimbriimonadaceae bacterium]
MGGVADTADRTVKVLSAIPGFATCGLAAFMGAPVVPILIFTAVTALGVAAQLKAAKDQAERDRVMNNFIRDVRDPYNTARTIAQDRWPETPQFDQLQLDWMKVLEAIAVEEADRVILELQQIDQNYWNWFAEYIMPRMAELQENVKEIGAPPIERPEPIANNDYFYANNDIPLVGREAEKELLLEFLKSDQAVAWLLMVGAAGSGKSRLGLWAMERALENGFRAGFLNKATPFDRWDEWNIHQDTFIIVDYALRRSGNLKNALDGLIGKRKGHKIRVLVVERNPIGTWWSELQAVEGRYQPRSDVQLGTGPTGGPHLDLGTMSHKGAVDLLKELARNVELPAEWTPEALADALERADPKRRPLFAQFLVNAVHGGDYRPNWTAQDLAAMVLDHEIKQRWVPHNIDGLHANLATAACALKGVHVGWLDSVTCLEGLTPRRGQRDHAQCQTVGGLGGGFLDGYLPSHEPDTLAELYILERLAGRALSINDEDAKGDTKQVLQCLWSSPDFSGRIEGSLHDKLVDLLQRAATNFLEHDGIELLRQVPRNVPEGVRSQALGHILAAEYTAASTSEDRAIIQSHVSTISDEIPDFQNVFARLSAQALFAITFDMETTARGKGALKALRELSVSHSNTHEVVLALARALTNSLSEMSDDSLLSDTLDEVKFLYSEHRDILGLNVVLAHAYRITVGKLLSDDERNTRLDQLKRLFPAPLADRDLIQTLARAFANAVYMFQVSQTRVQWLEELVLFSRSLRGAIDLGIVVARPLALALHSVSDISKRKQLLDELKEQARAGDPEIRLLLAQFLKESVSQIRDEIERLQRLDDLRQLAWDHPNEPDLSKTYKEARQSYNNRVINSDRKIDLGTRKDPAQINIGPQELNATSLSGIFKKYVDLSKIRP